MYDLGTQFHFNMQEAKSNPASIVKGNNYRITVLSERLVRIEYSPNGMFIDYPTQLVLCRNFSVPKFECIQDDKYLEISTKYFKLSYSKNMPITESSLRITLNNTDLMWYYGHPEIKTYDGGLIFLDGGKTKYTKGIYSLDGFSSIDDSISLIIDSNGNLIKKSNPTTDIYVFMYNNDFDLALKDYFKLTGKPQLLPRYSYGNWWSKNYGYNENTINRLFNRFEKEDIPISVLLFDKEWHIFENKYNTGYTFNNKLISKPDDFVLKMHNRGIRVGLHINPVEGIYPHETMYSKALEYIKVPNNSIISFAPFNHLFIDVFLKILIHPLEAIGIDFFWLDYIGKEFTSSYFMSHYMYLDSGRNEYKRNMLISRNPIIAAHRYGILYSGRSIISFDTLKNVIYSNNCASNIGISYLSSDIGGFTKGIEDRELFLRYIQLGCFSSIFRISVDRGKYYKREPWRWDINTFQIVKEYMQLRHKIVPYIYSEGYKYYNNGTLLINPLYHYNKELFYDPYYKNQYYFGTEMMVCPITTKKDQLMDRVIHKIYLPDGIWYDFKRGKKYPGNRSYVTFFKDEEYPVYVKSGAIIPMSIDSNNILDAPKNLEIQIFPGKSNTYEFYEDDGITNLYKQGYFLKTLIDYNYQDNNYTLIIRSIEGKSGIIPQTRNYKIRFRNTMPTNEVVVNFNGNNLESKFYEDENDFVVEINDVKTIGQLSINCKGKAIETDTIKLINEDIDMIISDLEVETRLKEKIASILFSDLPINKKRIKIKKLKKDKLDVKFIKMFLRLLEYVEQI